MKIDNLFFEKCRNKNTIFVDCFNTILYRIVSDDSVYDMWFSKLSILLQVSVKDLKSVWKNLKNYIYIKNEETEFSKYVENFYCRINFLRKINITYSDFYEILLTTMVEIENEVTIVNRDLVEVLKKIKAGYKKVFCVSDFYLPKDAVLKLFEKKGINIFDEIYISSTESLRKSSGNLYKHILKQNSLKPTECIMIGDNHHSDCKMANKNKLESFHYKNKSLIKEQYNGVLQSLLTIFYSNENLGLEFSNYSFSIFLFLKKLYKNVKSFNVKNIYFFSREGQFLKRLFDNYLTLLDDNSIKTHYLYVSRQSTLMSSLKTLDQEDFYVLKKQISNTSINNFLKNLNLDIPKNSELRRKYNFDEYIENFFEDSRIFNFFRESEFVENYESKRNEQKIAIKDYFNSVGINEDTEEVFIVDIGWKGTIQDNIYNIFDSKLKITGFYYGLFGQVYTSENSKKYGLIFSDYPKKSFYCDLFYIQHRLLERVFVANHASCLSYRNGQPVFNEYSTEDKKLYFFFEPVQKEILKNLESLFDINRKILQNEYLFDAAVHHLHNLFVVYITKKRLKKMSLFEKNVVENFGNFKSNRIKFDLRYVKKFLFNTLSCKSAFIQKILMVLIKLKLFPIAFFIRKISELVINSTFFKNYEENYIEYYF